MIETTMVQTTILFFGVTGIQLLIIWIILLLIYVEISK